MRGTLNNKSTRYQVFAGVWFSFIFLSLFLFANTVAAEAARNEARTTIKESFEALWAGQAFSPQLRQKQQALAKMLERETITRADLESMMAQDLLAIMNQQQTNRYILKKMPDQVDELLGSHLTWADVRKAVWLAAASIVEEGKQVSISVGTLAPAGTPWINVPEQVAAVIEEFSNKKYTIRIYAGGVMGEDTDILRKMDVGQLDGCGATALGIINAAPEASIFLLPGLFNSYGEVDYIFERFRERIDQAFEKRGYILASLIDTGNFHFFSKNRISSLADIKRSKVLTWFGTVETTMFDELGISAMPVSVTEVVSALSTGMADTTLAPAAWMLGMQAYQYTNYFIKEPLLYSPAAVFVSTGTRDRLQRQFGMSEIFSYNVQEMLVFEFSSVEGEWKSQLRKYEERCLEAFTSRVGMKAVTLPAADRKVIETAGRNVWTRLAGRLYPQALLDDILSALEEYRQKN